MDFLLRPRDALTILLLAVGATLYAGTPAPRASTTPAARQQALDKDFLLRRGMGVRFSSTGGALARPVTMPHARRQAQQRLHQYLPQPQGTASPALAGNTTTWQPAGPVQLSTPAYGLVTGRVSSLIADPNDPSGNTVYLGATGGGVWRSTNAAGNAGSVTFTPLTDDLSPFANSMQSVPSLSIGAITVEPGNPNVLLAGTGDPNDALDSYYGVGILRSTNLGQSWSLISQSSDAVNSGVNYSFAGAGFAGFAWSTTTTGLVVAAVSQSLEGLLVNTQFESTAETGLYYSADAGLSWHLATVSDGTNQIIQSSNPATSPPGNPATAVVWNAKRQMFIAAIRFHGYYSSTDGMNWTRLANQPGPNLTTQECPADPGGTGSSSCPLFRGALAVQPVTGDTFALTTDINNNDRGLYQDVCSASNGSCSTAVTFGTTINDTALDDPNAPGVIDQADYDMSLSAVSSQQDTILFAGTEDIYRCSLANSCAWRNTTNDQICASGMVAPSTHAIDGTWGANGLVYFGNDGGLWRTTDTLAQTGPVCSASDASHFQNLNGGIGSLAEITHLAVSPGDSSLVLAGMGEFGVVDAGSAAAQGGTGAWEQLATGDGSYVAIDPANPNKWYVSQGPGLSVFACANGGNCGAGSFGTSPNVDRDDIEDDADYFIDPAPWILDPGNTANLIVGTCRMWLGPVAGGWTSTNLLSGMLDGDPEPFCDGNAQLRSIGAGGSYNSAQGGEQMYAGMAGPLDGGGTVPGHLFGATVPQGGGQVSWSDLWLNPVTNTSLSSQFNAGGYAISAIEVDSHDTTGKTLYAGIAGFPYQQSGMLYRSTDAGAHWVNITNTLPPAPVNAVVVDPNNASYVYVAGDFGVYMTTNVATCSTNQNCWSQMGSNLPNAPVTDLALTASGSTNVLEASTYGRGIWTIGLTTTPVAATASLTPSSYSFPAQATGVSSSPVSFTLANTGSVAMSINSISVTTTDYAETNNCGSALSAGSSCTIAVTFKPGATGSRPGTLAVTTNAQPETMTAALNGTGVAPGALTLSPSTLSFQTTATGASSSPQDVTLQNTGGATLTLSSETIGGADTNDFSIASGGNCGATLAAGATCMVAVVFNPVQTGGRTATLQVVSSSSNSSGTVTLTGNGVAPSFLTLTPTSLSFAATSTGSTTQPQTITVTNTGGSTAQLGTASVSGDYVLQSNTCGSTLGPSATCMVGIAFSPQAQGNRAGLFTLPSPSVPAQQVTASLSGTGLAPATLTMSPNPVSFGAQEQGVQSTTQTVTVTNTAGGAAQLGAASITGDYAISTNSCTGTLAVQSSCSIAVDFTPTASGSRGGTLTLVYNNGPTVSTTLAGTGTAPPALAASPSAVFFPLTADNATSAPQSITITNNGGNAATISSVAVSANFALASSNCPASPQTLAAGGSCTLGITFTPPGAASYSGTATITGSFNDSPVLVSLSGQGAAPAAATFTPTSLSFPDTPQGSASTAQMLTLTSTGGVAVTLGTPTVPADYQIAGNNCPAQLQPETTCTLSIVFHPTATGARPGTLTQPGNMTNAPLTAALNGNGVAPGALSLAPQSLSFGAEVIGQTTAAQTVMLTNTGGYAATVGTPTVSGDYTLATNNCPASLGVNQSCTLTVTFTPTASGSRPGQLSVPGSGSGQPAIVTLDGTGETPGSLALSPSSVAFGTVATGSSATATVTATNTGQVAIHPSSLAANGDFAVTGGSCSANATIAPNGGSCTVTLTFTPSANGQRTGTFTLEDDGTPAQVTAALNGVGASPADLTLTPSAIAFGSVVDGTSSVAQTITATNSGGVAVSLGVPAITGAAFALSSTNCTSTLNAGASCTLQVTFAPTTAGAAQGQLAFPGQYTGSPAIVALSGTGLTPGAVSFSPSPVAFGSVVVKTTAVQPVTVSNTGQGSVTLGTPTASSGFGVASACPGTLAGGQSCTVTVSFSPAAAGQLSGLLSLPSSASNSAETDALSGTGVLPGALAASPSTLSFPATEIGSASASQTVTFTNSGGVSVALQPPSSASADYTVTATTCPASLAPAANCTAAVAFTPANSGSRPGTLTLSSSAANGPSAAVPLSGSGLSAPHLAFTPGSLSFGTQTDRTTSAAQMLTLTNSGGVTTNLGLPVITGPYTLTANTCASSLGAGASCTLSVEFAPTTDGTFAGSITVTAAGGSPSATAAFSGTGQALGLSPTALVFTPALNVGTTSSVMLIAVENLGAATINLGTPTVTGDFAVAQNSCTATLAANSACAYGITFTPTAGGTRTGTFTISDGAETETATLTGQGLSPATDGLSPTSLSFPLTVITTDSAAQSVTLTNTGGATLTGISFSVTGPFLVSNNCGSQLGGSLSCTLAVEFAPVSAGSASGTLTITDALRTQTVVLAGNGALPPTTSASPASLDFGPYALNVAAPVQIVSVQNDGQTMMTGLSAALSLADFTLTSNNCPATLPPGAGCQMGVVFTPQTTGPRQGTLTLTNTSGSEPLVVNLQGSGEDYSISVVGSGTSVITPGQAASYQLQVTPVGASAGTITISCVGAPLTSTCTPNPSTLAMTSNATGSITLSVATTSATTASASRRPGGWLGGIALALLAPVLFVPRRHRARLLGLVMMLGLLLLPTACGVHASGANGTSPTPPGQTASGTYTLTVGASFPGATRTTTVQLTVQ